MKKSRFTVIQILIHIYGWGILAHLLYDFAFGNISVNPIQDLELRTGRAALTLLVLSLMCTPLNTLFGWRDLLKRRRALGLYTFMYATIHVLIYIDLDYGLAWSLIVQNIFEKPRLLVGMAAFLMLVPLAFTSFDIWQKRLKKNWKRLHKTIYFIIPLVLLHFVWSRKGDVLKLQGEILKPLVFMLIVLILMVFRIPRVRKALVYLRTRFIQPFFQRIRKGFASFLTRRLLPLFQRNPG